MRDLFINLFEKLVNVLVIVMMIGVVAGAVAAFFVPQQDVPGPLVALGVLIGGSIYVVVMGGLMYLGLGIYQNTRRTADAIERLAAR